MSSAAPIIPTYSCVAHRFAKPLRHGEGLRFTLKPQLLGRAEAPAVFADVMQLHGRYFVTGPAFQAGEAGLMRNLVLAGDVAITTYNRSQEDALKIYVAATPAEALSLLWLLITAHYAIADAAAQVETYELRQATDRNQVQEDHRAALDAARREVEICVGRENIARQDYQARQRLARGAYWRPSMNKERENYCATAKDSLQRAINATTTAKQLLAAVEASAPPSAAVPVGNTSQDWIPEYPEAAKPAPVGDGGEGEANN